MLTAGSGTRLRPLTYARAKPAVPVAGRPLVAWILRALASAGVTDAVLNLHHRAESVAGAIGEGLDTGVRVRYSWENPVLGSAGGPRHALPLLGPGAFLLINGDTWPSVDLRALWDHHYAHEALVTMTLVPNPPPKRAGGWVTGFCPRNDPRPSYHFMSAQVVAPCVFADLPDGVPAESVAGIYPPLIARAPHAIRAFICDAPFIEIGTTADYLRVEEVVAAREGVAPFTPGRNVTIARSARVERSILWDDVSVGEGAGVSSCILGDGVRVPAGADWEGLAVVRAEGRAPQGDERIEGDLLLAPVR